MLIKKLTLSILLFTAISFSPANSFSQTEYKAAVGARFGYGIGITGLYMFNQRSGHGLEFLLRYGYHGLILNKPGAHIQVLYEKHWEIGRRVRGFTAYVGAGPAIGVGKTTNTSTTTYFALGLSPIAGIDYTTQQLRIPLILAFDYKPTLHGDFPISKGNQKPGYNFSYYEISFSVRIGLGK